MYRVSVPSKTFLVGEYAALLKGPALLFNTEPRFSMTIAPSMYHKISKLNDDDFFDPHNGNGGFGASSAKLLMMAVGESLSRDESYDPHLLLEVVGRFQDELGWAKGSGYDVLSQCVGGIAMIDGAKGLAIKVSWPFPDMDWVIVRGPAKVKTYEHLNDLENKDFGDLAQISSDCVQGFMGGDKTEFLKQIRHFYNQLNELNLVDPLALERIRLLEQIDGVLAVKGCGSLGLDSQVVIFEKPKRQLVLNSLSSLEVFTELSDGIKVKEE